MKTVAICDTEPVAMEGLRALLENTGEWKVVAARTHDEGWVDVVRTWNPAVAVFDRALGLQPALAAIARIRHAETATAPVVWGASIAEADAVALLRAGALAVVRKTCSLDRLLECLEAAARGATWVDEGLVPTSNASALADPRPLTQRELQVMQMVERSMRNREIAAALGIRVGTVKIHLRHIFEKTGIRGRYGLALFALRARHPAAVM